MLIFCASLSRTPQLVIGGLNPSPRKDSAVSPFIELGTGVQLVSKTTINANRFLGGAFQFGSRIGAGVAWGAPRRYEVLTFLEHVSNADISHPNDGATYIAIQFRVGL